MGLLRRPFARCWAGVRGLHGRCGHGAAGVERAADEAAGRGGARGFVGVETLKDAISEAMRDWVTNVRTTYYLLGSALGAHPYPTMVRDFHRCISLEMKEQILEREGRLPTAVIACVGGGSNAIGAFYSFLQDREVRLIGVEAGGRGTALGDHAVRFRGGSPGCCRDVFVCFAG